MLSMGTRAQPDLLGLAYHCALKLRCCFFCKTGVSHLYQAVAPDPRLHFIFTCRFVGPFTTMGRTFIQSSTNILMPKDGYTTLQAGQKIAPNIIMFLPRNADISQVEELFWLSSPLLDFETDRGTAMEEQQRTEELLQGQLELWHHALGYIKSMALKCAMDVGIPEAITRCGGAATLPDLLAATGLPPCNISYLRRLMRVLTVSGIFQQQEQKQATSAGEQEEAVYALTPASRLLVSEDGNGRGAPSFGQLPTISLLLGRTFVTPFLGMHPWIADERAAATSLFEREHGQAVWEMTRTSSSINGEFNRSMAADTGLIMHAVLTLSPAVFEGVTSLVDVGGANGTAAAAVARAFPHIKCTVLDLPHVIENAPAPDEAAGGNTVRFVAGDMFHHIPPAHAVLLKSILHDWNDDECIKILRQCKKAIPDRGGGGKVIILDSVVGSNPCDNICNETQVLFDLHIMFINGAEREEREWRKIFVEAGFTDYKITPILGFRSIIEVYP